MLKRSCSLTPFGVLWLVQATTELSARLLAFLVPWMALGWPHGPVWASAVALGELVPASVVLPWIGRTLKSRPEWTPRVVVGGRMGLAALSVVVAVVLWLHQMTPWVLLAWSVPMGVASAAVSVTLKTVVTQQFAGANPARTQSAWYVPNRLARVLGPAMAPLLTGTMGMSGVFALDAVVLTAAAAVVARQHFNVASAPATPGPTPRAPVRVPERVRRAFWVRGVGNLVWPVYTLGLPYLLRPLAHGLWICGGLAAVYGMASVAGSLWAGRRGAGGLWPAYGWLWAGIGLAFCGLGLGPPADAVAVAGMALLAPFAHVRLDVAIGSTPGSQPSTLFTLQQAVVNLTGAPGLALVPWVLVTASPAWWFPLAGLPIIGVSAWAALHPVPPSARAAVGDT